MSRKHAQAPAPGFGRERGPSRKTLEAAVRRALYMTRRDPLEFVRRAYLWDEHGGGGPRPWQAEVMGEIGTQLKAQHALHN